MNDCYYEKKDWRICAKEVSAWSDYVGAEDVDYYSRCKLSASVGKGTETRRERRVGMHEGTVRNIVVAYCNH